MTSWKQLPTTVLATLTILTILLTIGADGFRPALAQDDEIHHAGAVVLGASYGYGLVGVNLKHDDGAQVQTQHNVTDGYLRGSFFVTNSVALGAQFQSWSDQTNEPDRMNMRMTAAILSWHPGGGLYTNFGVGMGKLETEFGILKAQEVPPDTPPEEMPATQIVTQHFSHDAVGLLISGGYELKLDGPLALGIQADLWYLETLDSITSYVSSISVVANLYLF